MKKILISALGISLVASIVMSAELYNPKNEKNHLVIPMNALSQNGDKSVGEVVAVETKYGVAFYPNLQGITSGLHGFHIHENPDCGATDKGLGMKAGGHWDRDKTGTHSYPWDDKGHSGDLPALFVDEKGNANNPVLSPKIKTLAELKNHSLMVHVGGDNHHDTPAALGGGGARMICGVIK
ncbi:superoxide dismutase family protein [Helicobacter sp. MIT 05-5294]|uniref:superoxide dismutase family protein n=1 Tax=Helicobacter sp. MIT 05-5294 TaxID=1548150 RepID=UPI00051FB929|nr:superoxide dismutase family protein [Helicobacter sp. MIT 05-5294]TLD86070.1 superoxide dismutase [Helicobacter sp. MIT 05-5294]